MVPLPPTGIAPNRRNGTERVTTFGVMFRMTITSDGFAGTSLDDMLVSELLLLKTITVAAPTKSKPKVLSLHPLGALRIDAWREMAADCSRELVLVGEGVDKNFGGACVRILLSAFLGSAGL